MRNAIILFTCLLSIKAEAQQSATLNLMPVPAHMQQSAGKFRINNNFTVSVKSNPADTILFRAVNRMYQTLNRESGSVFTQQYISSTDTLKQSVVEISVRTKAVMTLGVDESYILNVGASKIRLTAANTIGALRGLQTLIQLCQKDEQGFYFPFVEISDMPRFKWRGIMIDVARHFIALDEIERNIDAMAAVKMNVLHWHLTDDEGFRVESILFPLLQKKGSNGDYYTQAELRGIVKYAAEQGIMIVPEFDMPGHSQSWFAGYPELASQSGAYRPGPRSQWQNEHPDPNRPKGKGMADYVATLEAPTFDATSEKAYAFLDKFIGEMATIFPSPYIHIGADENNGLAWKLNPAIVSWMQKHDMQATEDLQRYFVSRVYAILKKHHKQTIGWEELYNSKIPKDVIVQKWIPSNMGGIIKSHGSPTELAAQGNQVLVSEGFYLDVFMPASFHYNNPAFEGLNNPGVLGGEAAQWTELADHENISGRIWPRAGAVAERLWSPSSVKDVEDMYRRLFVLTHQLDQQGFLNLSNYHRALNRIAASDNAQYLQTLTDVLTPVKGYQKLIAGMMKGPSAGYQTSPLTAISDIVFVDSETAYKFRQLVKRWLTDHDKDAQAGIIEYLTNWQMNDARLHPLIDGDKRLFDIAVQSTNLASAASIGLEALERIEKGKDADEIWTKDKLDILNSYSKPIAETQIAVLPEILALVARKWTNIDQ